VTRTRASIDPAVRWRRCASTARGPTAGEDAKAPLVNVLDRAAVLMAFSSSAARGTFDITHEVLGRYAFGRPIASFQAVKHPLPTSTSRSMARSNAYYGAWALSHDHVELATAACGARAAASDAFETMSREMIQLHGGVGYTWEFDCHLFYRRAKLLGAMLGSADQWRDRLIERLGQRSTDALRSRGEPAAEAYEESSR
jgi:acyl-CoA dehydrogenase